MGCPIHVWAPMLAALAPLARGARMRWLASRELRRARTAPPAPPPVRRRWAPIQPHRTPGSTTD